MPVYKYNGLSDESKAKLVTSQVAALRSAPDNIKDEDDPPALCAQKDKAHKADIKARTKEIEAGAEAADACMAFGGREFKKGEPVKVTLDNVSPYLAAKLVTLVEAGLFSEVVEAPKDPPKPKRKPGRPKKGE